MEKEPSARHQSPPPRFWVLATALGIAVATLIAATGTTDSGDAAFPGFIGAIVLSKEGLGGADLWYRAPGGGDAVQLTSDEGYDHDAAYSADGTMIAFTHVALLTSDRSIWIMNADGSGRHEISNTEAGTDPAWSPGGTRLVFAISGELYLINVDGSGLVALTNTLDDFEADPDWSPDGTTIVFSTRHATTIENPTEIEVISPTGTGRHALTATAGQDETHPDWSPDGQHIAYDAANLITMDRDVFVMNADGGNQQNRTNSHDGWQQTPTFSPDGAQIAYAQSPSTTFALTQVYVMDADGTDPDRLSTGGIELLPDWQPLASQPTPTPSPTPTEPPANQRIWGDVDCDGALTTRDNQAELRFVLQQNPLSQTEPCPDIGTSAVVNGTPRTWGDEDCDGAVTTRDNQSKLRSVLQQNPLSQTEPCPDVGTPIEVAG